jgi:hypothetical protein
MAIGKYFGWLRVAPIWVGFMSGSFSIVREAVILFSDNPNPIWQRNLFWSCVLVAFIVSCLMAWVLKHQELLAEKAKNERPDIKGEIEAVDVDGYGDHFFSLKVRLTSGRAATTISGFKLTVAWGGQTYQAEDAPVKEYFIERNVLHPMPFETQTDTRFFSLEDLAKDNGVLFVKGTHREGWLRFLVRGVPVFNSFSTSDGREQFLKEGAELVLTVFDGYGNSYPIRYVSPGVPQGIKIRRIPELPEWIPLTPPPLP